jgi:benzoyl-CoA reductase/2-hydroxyglutaryl-CoA dehydratase subunit BcrC/BadD/HgdB
MAPETLAKIQHAVTLRPAELAKEKKEGKKVVGWFNYNIPEEIIFALGLTPVRLGTGGDDRLVEIGSRYISSKNCVFVRELVGLFAEAKDPYIASADLIAVDATCLQIYRAAEVIKYYFKANTVILGVPRNFSLPESHEYFRQEVRAFTKKLEQFSGTTLDLKKLDEAIGLYDEIRKSTRKLYAYQHSAHPPISWRETFGVVQAGYYLDRRVYASLLVELLDELKTQYGEPVRDSLNGDARILLSGSIIPPQDTKLINIIERAGGSIVADDLWSGFAQSLDVNIKEHTLDGIAEAYLNRVPHAALPYLDLATDKRLANLRELIKEYRADGVIYHTLRYCDPFTFKASETKSVLQDEGVSFLEIHTEYAGSDIEPIRTRAEAFIEMIKSKKELEA